MDIRSDYEEYHRRAEAFFYDIIDGFKAEMGYRVVCLDPIFYRFKLYEQETGLFFDMSIKTRRRSEADKEGACVPHYVLTPYVHGSSKTGIELMPGTHFIKIVNILDRDEIHSVMEEARKRAF